MLDIGLELASFDGSFDGRMIASVMASLFETQWNLLMVKRLDLIKASKWYLLMEK